MTTTTTTSALVRGYLDVTRLAVTSFLARYREPTLTAYTQDLKAYLGWCQTYNREVLRVTRGELEMYVRYLEGRGYAAATAARRSARSPRSTSTPSSTRSSRPTRRRPRPGRKWPGRERSAPCCTRWSSLPCSPQPEPPARTTTPWSACSACSGCGCQNPARLTSPTSARGRLHVVGKGAKPADIPLPIPALRAVQETVDGRTTGPILRTRTGRRMDRAGASRALTRVANAAGITRPTSPHGLRRTFCTTGLVAGISIRDMQYAMRHADPRTTMRYDMAKANLDRHAAHAVAAYLAGMSTG